LKSRQTPSPSGFFHPAAGAGFREEHEVKPEEHKVSNILISFVRCRFILRVLRGENSSGFALAAGARMLRFGKPVLFQRTRNGIPAESYRAIP